MSDVVFPYPFVALDTCCIVTLYASGFMDAILASLPVRVAFVADVVEEEVRRMHMGLDERAIPETIALDLSTFVSKNLLHTLNLENEVEQTTVVELAFLSNRKIGNNDLLCSAIAVCRHWSLGTDDKDTIQMLQHTYPQLHLVTALDLLKYWADTTHAQFSCVQKAVKNMRRKATYKPCTKHHLYVWWQSHLAETM